MVFRPRISTRRRMAFVFLIATILALAVPVVEVDQAEESHVHLDAGFRWFGGEPRVEHLIAFSQVT